MRNLLLSVALIALPVGVFAAVEAMLPSAPPDTSVATRTLPPLGDLSRYETIAADVSRIAASGDMSAAEARATDFETLWDKEAADLRAMNKAAWNRIDSAADDVFAALRAAHPDSAKVTSALTALTASLVDTSPAAEPTGPVKTVQGIAVSDGSGKPLPCEELLAQLKTAVPQVTDPKRQEQVKVLQAKGTERCNADDDARADAFFAQGLALARN